MPNSNFKNSKIMRLSNFIQYYFTIILLAVYALAAIYPKFGIIGDKYTFFHLNIRENEFINITTPMLLLGIIVFNAALSINIQELLKLRKNIFVVISAIGANFILGAIFFLALKLSVSLLLSNNETQQIIIAIAILTAVPIAGTATAWTQTNKGNTALTLQILLITTLLSPLIAPFVLKFSSFFLDGVYAEKMFSLASKGVSSFLVVTVVVPAVAGLIMHHIIKDSNIYKFIPFVRLSNQVALMFLIYINSAVILPGIFMKDSNIIITCLYLLWAVIYCVAAHSTGWMVSIFLKSPLKDEIALIFSEGMKNVAAALVIANFIFPELKNIGLMIIFFAIIQQLLASSVRFLEYKKLVFIRKHKNKLTYKKAPII